MGKPTELKEEHKNNIYTLLTKLLYELSSASSSLHMDPQPIDPPPKDAFYLAELDHWVKHSCRHISAALEFTHALQECIKIERTKHFLELIKLKERLAEAEKEVNKCQ